MLEGLNIKEIKSSLNSENYIFLNNILKEENPDQVHKMPEKAEGFNPIDELLTIPVPKAQPDRKHVVEHYEDPAEHVGCMQTGDRVVNSKKCTVLGLVGGEALDVSHVQRNL